MTRSILGYPCSFLCFTKDQWKGVGTSKNTINTITAAPATLPVYVVYGVQEGGLCLEYKDIR